MKKKNSSIERCCDCFALVNWSELVFSVEQEKKRRVENCHRCFAPSNWSELVFSSKQKTSSASSTVIKNFSTLFSVLIQDLRPWCLLHRHQPRKRRNRIPSCYLHWKSFKNIDNTSLQKNKQKILQKL